MRLLIAAIDDLFFMPKVKDAAVQAGMTIEFAKGREDAILRASRAECLLVIVDLNAGKMEPVELVRELKTAGKTVLGFLSHVNVELREKAVEAGADRVLARSAFSQNIVQILKEY